LPSSLRCGLASSRDQRHGREPSPTPVSSRTTHPSAWPVTVLMLGNPGNPAHTYSKSELLKILGLASKGDASLILAQQEIAAKLNIAHGSNPAPIASNLTTADNLLGAFPGKLPYKVAPSSPNGSALVATASRLED